MALLDSALSLGADSGNWLSDWGWAALLLLGLFVVSLYLWSYLSKNFEKMKVKESDHFDADVIGFISRMVKIVIVIVLVFVGLYVLSQIWTQFRTDFWEPYLGDVLDIVFVAFVLLLALLIVRILRSIARKARMTTKEQRALHGSAVEFTSLLLSYIVYAVAAIIVLVALLTLVPNIQPSTLFEDFLRVNGTKIGTTVVFIIAIYAIVKLVEAILEDYKFRTKKFNPQVIDLFKDAMRYVLYTIAFLTVIFIIFSILGLEPVGFIVVILTLIFISLGISLSYSTIRNIVSGVAIMNTDIFDVGDRVRLGSDLVCEVLEKNLVFTKVKDEDGETVDVPNSEVISERVFNYSRTGTLGVNAHISVSNEVPHADVQKCIMGAIEKVEGITRDPSPEVVARGFESDKIVYEVVVYTRDTLEGRRIKSDLIFRIQDAFRECGIKP
jgi:small-conductance mechanosensitive channel